VSSGDPELLLSSLYVPVSTKHDHRHCMSLDLFTHVRSFFIFTFLNTRITHIGVQETPLQFIKFLCMSLQLERTHVFQRNSKFLLTHSVKSETILLRINRRRKVYHYFMQDNISIHIANLMTVLEEVLGKHFVIHGL